MEKSVVNFDKEPIDVQNVMVFLYLYITFQKILEYMCWVKLDHSIFLVCQDYLYYVNNFWKNFFIVKNPRLVIAVI